MPNPVQENFLLRLQNWNHGLQASIGDLNLTSQAISHISQLKIWGLNSSVTSHGNIELSYSTNEGTPKNIPEPAEGYDPL